MDEAGQVGEELSSSCTRIATDREGYRALGYGKHADVCAVCYQTSGLLSTRLTSALQSTRLTSALQPTRITCGLLST